MLITPSHSFIKSSQEIIEICKPLELLQINHFTYQKQFNDGSRISLSNKPKWIEDYYNLKLFQTSLFEGDCLLYKPSYEVWLGDHDLEVYRHGKQYYNTSHSITISEPQQDGCAFYLFSAPDYCRQSIIYLGENKDILYRFILYFKDRAAKLLNKAEKNKLILQPVNNHDSLNYLSFKTTVNHDMNDKKREFYKATRIYKYFFEDAEQTGVKLSKREVDCIIHLLKNRTASETADYMSVSRRTIESYFENIKIKLNCTTKMELLDKLKGHPFLLAE